MIKQLDEKLKIYSGGDSSQKELYRETYNSSTPRKTERAIAGRLHCSYFFNSKGFDLRKCHHAQGSPCRLPMAIILSDQTLEVADDHHTY